ncbi:MAG: translocation/assembly module TamB domain-containing protein, partial [Methylococcales bacterium]|nr:translocation/assembly module TamB domain-containing protein [Methylococcales bacterium]
KLQIPQYPGSASFTVSAELHGASADLDVALAGGQDTSLHVSGRLPLTGGGSFDLHGDAALDLKWLDPLLNADGRTAGGQLQAKATLGGGWSSPVLDGGVNISHGQWQDFSAGIALNDISAALAIENGSLRISEFTATAGPGKLTASGGMELLAAGLPVDLKLTARNARPLASDQLTVNLDADLTLQGQAVKQLALAGDIRINRAEIRVPERIPASIAVLKLSNAPAPPPVINSNIALNLTIAGPQKIFIRGRGLYAELGGALQIGGNLQEPVSTGQFTLRSGQFNLAGQTLDFSKGAIRFDNNLTNPALDFVANASRNNIQTTLTVSGSVRKPKFTLSSIPQAPQDEILANLLFGNGTASLSPMEMVQIASALASLTGVGAGIDDPLETARKTLGLDRLSAGGANPSLEGGRYIAPGVYLGAKQGVTGGDPQATVQIDVTKHLKLEGSVGSGTASPSTSGNSTVNSLGLIYQFEY